MFHISGVLTGEELNLVQKLFDEMRRQDWFRQSEIDELEVGAHLMHLYLSGFTDATLLAELCERASFRRCIPMKALDAA